MNRKNLRRVTDRPWLLPDKVMAYSLVKLTRRFGLGADSFGWLQSILYSCRIDQWQRYASVAQQIKALDENPSSILDVGGGDGAFEEFVDPERYHLYVLDVKMESLRGVDACRIGAVVGDGCALPFRDDSFDVVMSVDSLEHVPGSQKTDYCCELKRVAKRYVIIHCPADSSDGMFQGTMCDTGFQKWYRQRFGADESNTAEHLESGLPKVEELEELFPGATVVGRQNCEIWSRYMVWLYTAYVRIVAGPLYRAFLRKRDNVPPYHACLLVWEKR